MSASNTGQYADDVAKLRADDPELAAELAILQGLESVLLWMERRALHRALLIWSRRTSSSRIS